MPIEVGKYKLEEEAPGEAPPVSSDRVTENLTKALAAEGNGEESSESFDETGESFDDAPPVEPPPPPPPGTEPSAPVTDYRSFRRKGGAPAFSEAELRLLEADPRSLKPRQKAEREKLQNRAAKYRMAQRVRKEKGEDEKEEADLAAVRRAEALEQLTGATGKEPYQIVNGGLEFAESLSGIVPVLSGVDRTFVETFRYSEKFMDDQAALTKTIMLRNPVFAKWLLVEGAPELRLGFILYLDAKEKVRLYRERRKASASETGEVA